MAQLSQKNESLMLIGVLFLLGDQVDEAVEHDAGLHALGGGRHERILDLGHAGVCRKRVHRVVVLHAHISADDVLLRVTTRGRMHDGETVIAVGRDLLVGVLVVHRAVLLHTRTVLVLRVLAEQVGHVVHIGTTVEEEPNRIAPGAVAEHLKQSVRTRPADLVGLASDRIGQELASVVTATVGKATRGFTVREEHGVNDLQPVVLAELGHDLHGGRDGLVKRRAAQTKAARESVVRRTFGLSESNGEQVFHRLLELIRAHLGRQEVQQTEHMELSVDVGILDIPLLTADALLVVILASEILVNHAARERIDLERNVAPAAEQSDLHELLHGVKQRRAHRTRPVDEHDESVILALAHHSVAAEDVIGDLVVHHANGVKDAGAGDRGTLRSISSLAEVELLCHQRHHRRRVRSELGVVLASPSEQVVVSGDRVGGHGGAVLRDQILNLCVGDDDLVQVARRQTKVLIRTGLLVGHVLDRRIELLLRDRRRRSRLVLHLVRTRTRGSASVVALRGRLVGVAVTTLASTLLAVGGRTIVRRIRVSVVDVRPVGIVLTVTTRRDRRSVTVLASIASIGASSRVLLLLLRFLLEARLVLPDVVHDVLHIVKSTASVDALDERLLHGRELNTRVHASAHLVVKVDAVDQRQLVEVAPLDAEEVAGDELLIRLVEVAAHTGELLLHQLFDAGVLHDVHVDLSNGRMSGSGDLLSGTAPRALHLVVRIGVRREQRVTNLVADEHIVDLVGHARPGGQDQDAVLGVERGRAGLGVVLHGDVLRGEDARQQILAGGVDGAGGRRNGRNSLHRPPFYQNPVKPASLESIFSKSL